MEIGAQLYTVREFCKNTEDFAETLKKIADIGYRNVQVSGTCAYDPEWLRDQLTQNGLSCVLTHTPADLLLENAESVAAAHNVFQCGLVGLGYYYFDPEKEDHDYEEFLRKYKPVAEKLAENGKYFMYHNHDGEFQRYGGKTILKRLSEDFTANEMGFTLDTFWIQAGGADPADWIRQLSGRVPCIHLKDFSYGRKMAVVGEGNLNFERVFQEAEAAGTKYMLVEQDDCDGEDPFACLARSYNNLRAFGFR